MTLIDKLQLLSAVSDVVIYKIDTPLSVRGIGSTKHQTDEYIIIPIYFPGTQDGNNKVLTYIRREIYLVNNLRAKILIGNDISVPKGFVIDITNKKANIGSYSVDNIVNVYSRG